METDYAIVVGIAKYPQLSPLEGPERDADDFHAWVTAADGGGVPAEHVTRIVTSLYEESFDDGKPTTELIDSAFMKLVRLGRKNEGEVGRRLYIYFSGHGIAPDLEMDESALLMANAARDTPGYHIPGRLYASAIRLEGLFDEVVLFMDCCRDDYERVSRRPTPWIPVKTVRGGRTRAFYGFATRWGLKAREKPIHEGRVDREKGVYRGVFTVALMEALRGHSADKQARVTGSTVSGHIHSRVRELLEEAEYEKPQFDFDPGDDIVFVDRVQAPPVKGTVRVTIPHPAELTGPGAAKSAVVPGVHAMELAPGFYALRDPATNRTVGFQVMGEGGFDASI